MKYLREIELKNDELIGNRDYFRIEHQASIIRTMREEA
jgi:hypothetical protein